MKSRGKRGGKREKERRLKIARHGTTKPSDLSAEKPTNQPSTKPDRQPFADDSDTADKPTDQPSDLLADKTTDQPSDQSADKPMLSLPDSSDESEGAIVEAIRRALRKKKARKMEEAEGLLGREMRDGEKEVQTHAGAGGQSNEHINTPPSNELSNAPSSNVHINVSLRKKTINTPPSEGRLLPPSSSADATNDDPSPRRWNEDRDVVGDGKKSEYELLRERNIARNESRLRALGLLTVILMIRPVTGHVTASEPHDIADARSSTPPK